MILPQGVSRRDFDAALSEFSAALGAEWVFRSEEDIALYRNAYTPFFGMPEQQRQAGAAVAPASVEQVQQVVRIANKYKIPLYAISTGRNLGYGGAAPALSGSVVVDLKRMNKVLEVNVRDAYVLVEPGVSFIDLSRYFVEHNLPFMVSSAENGAGGPIGNALDHGCSNVRGDNFAAVCGMEVVLPNGEVLRTGSGAVPNPKLWQNYKYGFGPFIEGMFSQSNFGIVTKMGFWLERQPEVVQAFSVTSSRSDDLAPLIDAVQLMRNEGLVRISGGGSPLRSANAATNGAIPRGIKAVDELLAKPGGGAASEWDALSRETGIPISMAMGNIRGPDKVVQATLEYCRDTFAKIPGTAFNVGRTYRFPLDPSTINVPERNGIGFPNLWAFQRLAVQGTNRGHYYFSPNILATAEDMLKVNVVLRKVMSDFGDEEMLHHWGWQGGIGFYPKNYTILGDFVVRDDPDFNRKRVELFTRLVHTAADNGWAEYRTPTEFQDLVMGVYNYNNGVLRRFAETIKDAIDPNGIFSPGRGGIWPKRFRKA
jgi:4-cresol dehydrogenase (hydroxylating)